MMNYKCPHCNSTLPAHIATCPVLSEHNNVATWEEITRLREEIERLRPDAERYEELRSLIDDGNEAMTHDDAVKELAGMRELEAENERLTALWVDVDIENERLRKELASYRKGDCRRKIDKAMEGE